MEVEFLYGEFTSSDVSDLCFADYSKVFRMPFPPFSTPGVHTHQPQNFLFRKICNSVFRTISVEM